MQHRRAGAVWFCFLLITSEIRAHEDPTFRARTPVEAANHMAGIKTSGFPALVEHGRNHMREEMRYGKRNLTALALDTLSFIEETYRVVDERQARQEQQESSFFDITMDTSPESLGLANHTTSSERRINTVKGTGKRAQSHAPALQANEIKTVILIVAEVCLILAIRGVARTPIGNEQEVAWAILVLWYLVGILVNVNSGFDFTESIYGMTQIISTVGYGDINPSSQGMKLFYALHMFIGFFFVTTRFNVLFGFDMKKQIEDLMKRKLEANLPVDDKMAEAIVSAGWCAMYLGFGTLFYSLYERCTCSYGAYEVADCDNSTLFNCAQTGGYQKSLIQSFYMSLVTLCTIGMGAIAPKTKLGRLVMVPYQLFGVTAFTKVPEYGDAVRKWMQRENSSVEGDAINLNVLR